MTESQRSQLEKLLHQMPVEEPSEELDARISDCLDQNLSVAVMSQSVKHSSQPSWLMLAMVAVVCLLVGSLIGRSSDFHAVASEANSPNGDSGATVDGDKDQEENGDSAVRVVSLDAPMPAGMKKHGRLLLKESLISPPVSMVCAMAGHPAPGTTQEGCLSCHDGLTAAGEEFRENHQGNPQFQTCMWCHDVRDATSLDEIHGIQRFNRMQSPLHPGMNGVR